MVKVEKSSNSIIEIFKGSAIAIVATIILLIIFATVLTYSNISESTMPTVIIVITALSILIGSQITTTRIKKNGIVNGATVGIIYILFLYLISSCVISEFSLSNYSIIMMATSVIIGGLGGIIGVNRKG